MAYFYGRQNLKMVAMVAVTLFKHSPDKIKHSPDKIKHSPRQNQTFSGQNQTFPGKIELFFALLGHRKIVNIFI